MKFRHLPYRVLTFSAFVALIVSGLMRDAMFMDGLQYACVAMNMASGLGDFWHPFMNDAWIKAGSHWFMEHPPLVYFLQSWFFRILGEGLFAERLYCLLSAVTTGGLIVVIWRHLHRQNQELKKLSWLPVLLWVSVPVCFWSFQNNMLENTMGVFVLAAVYSSLRAASEAGIKAVVLLLLSGISVFLASISKGVPGLFPVVTIAVFWLINRNMSFVRMVLYSVIIIGTTGLLYLFLLLDNDARESLRFYVFERLMQRIGAGSEGNPRFYLSYRLIWELIPMMSVSVIIILIAGMKEMKKNLDNKHLKNSLVFILIGLSGSLPLLMTPVQKGFYMVASFPFFAIGFALSVSESMNRIIERIVAKRFLYKATVLISFVLLGAALIYTYRQYGKPARDKEIIHDVRSVGNVIPSGAFVSAEAGLLDNWTLIFNIYRRYKITVTYPECREMFFLTMKGDVKKVPPGYHRIERDLEVFDLYRKAE